MRKTSVGFFLVALSVASWSENQEGPMRDLSSGALALDQNSTLNTDHGFLEALICEGEKKVLQCEQYELIRVRHAFWGRSSFATCSEAPVGLTAAKLCETQSENTLSKINAACNHEQSCEITASNVFFNDNSCANVYKYAHIQYECVEDKGGAVDLLSGEL